MIPARIGSKRIPKKNLRLIEGQPLISYVLETIKETDVFDEVYLNALRVKRVQMDGCQKLKLS